MVLSRRPAQRCGATAALAPRRRHHALVAAAASSDGGGLLEQDALAAASISLDQTQLDLAVQRAVERLRQAGLGNGGASGGSGGGGDVAGDRALSQAIHRVVEEEVHTAFESELQAVHTAFEQEMVATKQTVKDAVDAALHDGSMKFDVTANVNTVMAITAVIAYWRGVGGLLDILFEDSLEGYVACVAFGWLIILLIKVLKLPVVEGNSLGL
ncbi:expressed protein [Chlorella variabilis]|uniref:Expressed protein n=1 Tax=Chlorella variabilis TaxID=554065 RepID=E1ZTS5_CHLVA|nr:expressed protein [Chlorella variabilis]EFN50781.1 expressed protein [Chlorella variabilis]|eukprot:XP_005852318.1 expressed protein [Chlorella variabilis]